MIYKNEYGEVDLLSKQFLQSLKSDKGVIGAKLSGGSDTALLLYLLAKEIQERNLNFSILPYTFLDKPDRNIVAQMIIDEVKSNFPKVSFEKHFYTGLTIPYRDVWNESAIKLSKEYDVVFFTNAVNKSPPIEIISNKELARMVSSEKALRNYDTKDLEYLGIYDTPEYKPFEHVDKRFTAQVYEDLFLLETLFPLTRSCLSEDVEKTNYHEKPCKECYWCEEKFWAFGQYDAEEYEY